MYVFNFFFPFFLVPSVYLSASLFNVLRQESPPTYAGLIGGRITKFCWPFCWRTIPSRGCSVANVTALTINGGRQSS